MGRKYYDIQTETNRFRYIKDTVIHAVSLMSKSISELHTVYRYVSSSLTTALLNNNFFKIFSFRQHLLFTNFYKYAILKISKFIKFSYFHGGVEYGFYL